VSKTILVAEDDPDTLRLVALSLEQQGYQVLTAQDGQAAIDAFNWTQPDLVVLDMMMPKMSGFEVLNWMKGNRMTAHVPVVGLSALVTETDVKLAVDRGIDAYVRKPFRIEELMRVIEGCLRH
jgi:DNA-binding response OmpR family regulator